MGARCARRDAGVDVSAREKVIGIGNAPPPLTCDLCPHPYADHVPTPLGRDVSFKCKHCECSSLVPVRKRCASTWDGLCTPGFDPFGIAEHIRCDLAEGHEGAHSNQAKQAGWGPVALFDRTETHRGGASRPEAAPPRTEEEYALGAVLAQLEDLDPIAAARVLLHAQLANADRIGSGAAGAGSLLVEALAAPPPHHHIVTIVDGVAVDPSRGPSPVLYWNDDGEVRCKAHAPGDGSDKWTREHWEKISLEDRNTTRIADEVLECAMCGESST